MGWGFKWCIHCDRSTATGRCNELQSLGLITFNLSSELEVVAICFIDVALLLQDIPIASKRLFDLCRFGTLGWRMCCTWSFCTLEFQNALFADQCGTICQPPLKSLAYCHSWDSLAVQGIHNKWYWYGAFPFFIWLGKWWFFLAFVSEQETRDRTGWK